MANGRPPRVALVHDWLVGGGAERVVLELHRMFPEAPIYTSYATEEWHQKLDGKVIAGFLQRWPFPKLRKYIPFLRAWWFSRLKLNDFDVIISSSGAEAKGIKVPENTLHINYCHAPTHYYWSRYDEYIQHPGFGIFDPLARLGLKLLVGPMRKWDYNAAQRPHYLIANSTHTQAKIKEYYGRGSTVIFPPVDVERFKKDSEAQAVRSKAGYLAVGRQTPYKRIDLAVAACTQLNLPLTVIGKGPDHDKLVDLAGPSVTFHTNINDTEIVQYFQAASYLIFPGVDDFGITAVEALAAGTPVIAYNNGGAVDYVSPDTGIFFAEQSVEALVEALKSSQDRSFNETTIRQFAAKFSTVKFRESLQLFLDQHSNERSQP